MFVHKMFLTVPNKQGADPGILKREFQIPNSRLRPLTPSKTKLFMNAFNGCYKTSYLNLKQKN